MSKPGLTATVGRARGQALLELALVAPLLLLFLLGVVLFGRILAARATISAAAGEAARVVAQASSEQEGLSVARQRAQDVVVGDGLSASRLTLTIDDGGFVRGGTVTVHASYQVPVFDLPLGSQVVGGPFIIVRATDQERIELYRARQP